VGLRDDDPEAAAAGYAAAVARARALSPVFGVHLSGKPHLDAVLGDTLRSTLQRIVPAASLVLALVLWMAFRRPRGVLVPLVSMLAALLWTFALGARLGYSLNLVTVMVPPLVLTLAFAYCMHVVSEHYTLARERSISARASAAGALAATQVPLLITGITTLAGFLALTLSTIPAIAEFGVLSSLGVLASMVAALVLCPSLLAVLPAPRTLASGAPEQRLPRFASHLSDFDFHHRKAIIATSLVVLALAAAAASRIEIGMNYGATFHPDSAIRRDFHLLNEKLAGANPFALTVRASAHESFREPEALRRLSDLQAWLESQPEVGGTVSAADYVRVLHRAFEGDDPAAFAIPGSRRLVHQLLLFGGSDDLDLLLDPSAREATVFVRSHSQESAEIAALASRVEAHLADPAHGLEGHVGGSLVAASRTIEAISHGQLRSLLAATAVIFIVLSAMFTSLRMGVVALLPNVLIVLIYLGVLGLAGIPLGPTTSLIGCIALGIAVDDTVHYFARFNADAKKAVRKMPATKSALRAVIRPVSFTSLGLCLGFLTLTFSEIQTQVQFGGLAALALAAAWLVDVTLTPALACSVRIVTLWDVLGLDLGQDPTGQIPLFQDLSLREARVVALMGERRVSPAGTQLFKAVDPLDTLIVVTGGELSMYVEEWGQRVRVARLGRGDVVGHGELFAGPVHLDVETDGPVRMLLFTTATLEGLRRRYPRIGAKIYRNLNRVQSRSMNTLLEWLSAER
ncbi:MAG: MMPL family transporter, partial [Myxococcales bacterium]|nr:MMPL family transporter [Myxococcales bacterium]